MVLNTPEVVLQTVNACLNAETCDTENCNEKLRDLGGWFKITYKFKISMLTDKA